MFKYVTFEIWYDGFGWCNASCQSLAGSEDELLADMTQEAHRVLTSSPWNFDEIDNADLDLVVISIEPW